jgi:hypothetical protein
MGGGFLNTRGLFVMAAAIAALLLGAGCGGSSDPEVTEVTVKTGSLSKAAFVKKADAICEAARTEFVSKFTSFFKAHESALGDKQKEQVLLGEILESILTPNVEGQIKEISKLGSPKPYAPEVASFLNALQKRLGELQDDPSQVTGTPYLFKEAENIAAKAGMQGCAESFS